MSKLRNTFTGAALAGALVAGGLVAAPAASAASAAEAPRPVVNVGADHLEVTPALVNEAIAEARRAGAVKREDVQPDGTRSVTIDGGDGFEFTLNETDPRQRLGFGSDNRGVYIAFNTFDQNVIIGGTGAALLVGICALGPAACVVGDAAVILGASYIATHSKCPSPKSVRVYPVTKKSSRCV
ncbi:hypothetical protein [Curtobacterium sp. VKM Ac-1393]|uniref:hypothetical protein n=1 Tax=Curtobacterium sp. VKM Ac-1393 TaxID=2783814 RepID=UPI00188A843A|nr:hypothetical protein [Curtobacterium sp. VKM Ac-1393]MBF4607943.1 hypothetical protein [Curtobacterium sp. VKM Ac-1393]